MRLSTTYKKRNPQGGKKKSASKEIAMIQLKISIFPVPSYTRAFHCSSCYLLSNSLASRVCIEI
jgi:hypothetical protein